VITILNYVYYALMQWFPTRGIPPSLGGNLDILGGEFGILCWGRPASPICVW